MKQRLIWADSLKGWLMILVILGHAIQTIMLEDYNNDHVWNIIYSFHMPAFMAVSGWFAYRQKQNGGDVCLRRCKQLLVPYVMWGAPDKPCGVGRADANPKLLLNDT